MLCNKHDCEGAASPAGALVCCCRAALQGRTERSSAQCICRFLLVLRAAVIALLQHSMRPVLPRHTLTVPCHTAPQPWLQCAFASAAAAAAEVAEALGIGKLADAGRATSVQAITAKTGEGVKPAVQVSRLMLASSQVLRSPPKCSHRAWADAKQPWQ